MPTPHDPPTDLTHFQQYRKKTQNQRYNAVVGSGRAAGSSEPPPAPAPHPFPAIRCCLPPPPRRPIKAPPSRATTRSPKARRTAHDRLGIVNVLPAGVTSYATLASTGDAQREGRGVLVCGSCLGELAKQLMQKQSTSRQHGRRVESQLQEFTESFFKTL